MVTDSFYSIFIRTGDASTTELEKLIQFSMQGSKGSLEKKLLKDYARDKGKSLFQRGNTDQFDIPNDDIGKVKSLKSESQLDVSRRLKVSPLVLMEIKRALFGCWNRSMFDIRRLMISRSSVTVNGKVLKVSFFSFQTDSWLSNRLGSDFSWLCVKSEPSNSCRMNASFLFSDENLFLRNFSHSFIFLRLHS